MEVMINLKVGRLKEILDKCDDDLDVIIPVIDEDDANHIRGFRHVRTVGLLCSGKDDALCLNAAQYGLDISSQVGSRAECKKVYF